jgi:membrane fusion protein, heavy metal efflux system
MNKQLLIALSTLLFCTISHAENSVKISQENFNNLGVTLGKLDAASQIPLLTAPAKVVVPPEQEYVVSASQAGLITKMNAAIGDSVKKGDVLVELILKRSVSCIWGLFFINVIKNSCKKA